MDYKPGMILSWSEQYEVISMIVEDGIICQCELGEVHELTEMLDFYKFITDIFIED